ncbi:MAG: hypothetical protein KKA79_00355, partial [Nanoarchaeota archaeon]|nr:hypothetical protein [Nanoarchaeota archaeon]
HIKALPEVKVINTRIASLDALINRDSDSLEHFKAYFEHKAEVKEFEEKIGNFNKQFSISLVAESILENKGLDKFETKDKKSIINAQEHFKEKNKAITTSLEEYLKAEGFDVEVKDMVNPADTYIPFYLGAIGGLLFPLFRNLLVKGYVRGSRGNGYEYMGSTMAGLVNGSIGLFLIDGLHPLVYPIRMFATPFILQPIFKMTGFDPAKIFAES